VLQSAPLAERLSWGALALVLAFKNLVAEIAIAPMSAQRSVISDQVAAGLVRVPVFLVTA
jgi:hypothetical protein